MLPVSLTVSPSSTFSDSPSTTAPISSSSRLSATPATPRSNSRRSFAMQRGSPEMRAIPSPEYVTRPTSSRSTDGLYPSTYFRSTAAISLGSIVNSDISASPEFFLRKLQAPAHRRVEHQVADACNEPADHGGIDDDLQRDLFSGGFLERLLEPRALVVVQRNS